MGLLSDKSASCIWARSKHFLSEKQATWVYDAKFMTNLVGKIPLEVEDLVQEKAEASCPLVELVE